MEQCSSYQHDPVTDTSVCPPYFSHFDRHIYKANIPVRCDKYKVFIFSTFEFEFESRITICESLLLPEIAPPCREQCQ